MSESKYRGTRKQWGVCLEGFLNGGTPRIDADRRVCSRLQSPGKRRSCLKAVDMMTEARKRLEELLDDEAGSGDT